jgi:hypothetical protein
VLLAARLLAAATVVSTPLVRYCRSSSRDNDDVVSIIRPLSNFPFCSALPPAALAIVCRDVSLRVLEGGNPGTCCAHKRPCRA